MTKVLLISDDHKLVNPKKLIKKTNADIVIHLGDSEQPKFHQKKLYKYFVQGNRDSFRGDVVKKIKIEEMNFLISHGHTLGVDYKSKEQIEKLVKKIHPKADGFIFGHLHFPIKYFNKGFWIINPGSIGDGRGKDPKRTYAIIKIDGKEIKEYKVYEYDGN